MSETCVIETSKNGKMKCIEHECSLFYLYETKKGTVKFLCVTAEDIECTVRFASKKEREKVRNMMMTNKTETERSLSWES